MLFVRVAEREYIPFLRSDGIKLKDARSNSLTISSEAYPEMLVKDIDAEMDEAGEAWFKCNYQELRVILERKADEIAFIKEQMISGNLFPVYEVVGT